MMIKILVPLEEKNNSTNKIASKYTQHERLELQRKFNNSMIITEDFNTSLAVIDTSSNEKIKVSKI